MTQYSGSLFIVAAPSGAGKTSLVKSLVGKLDDIAVSVSFTTRPQREGEVDGQDYNFVSTQAFNSMVEDALFLEHANVFGNLYGTSQAWISEQLSRGTDIVLEIDWQGAMQVRKLMPESIGIFILPPSRETLRQRLQNRGQDDAAVIEARMQKAIDEMSHYAEFDYLVVNDSFDRALQDLIAIVQARRLRQTGHRPQTLKLISELLS